MAMFIVYADGRSGWAAALKAASRSVNTGTFSSCGLHSQILINVCLYSLTCALIGLAINLPLGCHKNGMAAGGGDV